jgi:hypothetical protein
VEYQDLDKNGRRARFNATVLLDTFIVNAFTFGSNLWIRQNKCAILMHMGGLAWQCSLNHPKAAGGMIDHGPKHAGEREAQLHPTAHTRRSLILARR